MPETNSGTTVAERPTMLMMRSTGRPTWRAAKTPPRIPSGTTMAKATSPSRAEFASAVPMSGATGTRRVKDMPMSPVTKWLIQSQYCTSSGRSTPSW